MKVRVLPPAPILETTVDDKSKEQENGEFEKEVLRHLGLPEDYIPEDENEAYRLVVAYLED